jgi:ADP-ribose pyrophosphatase
MPAKSKKKAAAKEPHGTSGKQARDSKVRVLSSKTVYQGKVFHVTSDEVVEPSGVRATRDIVRHQGSVVVLAVDGSVPDRRVLLIRQYRYAPDETMWEIPAGRIDEGEEALAGAKRELAEETGFTAKKWKRVLSFYPSPGFMSEIMHIFLAEELTKGKATPEEDERIAKRFFPLEDVVRMISSGKIRDGKTIAGVLWLAQKQR